LAINNSKLLMALAIISGRISWYDMNYGQRSEWCLMPYENETSNSANITLWAEQYLADIISQK
jgi:hypothetical protein